MQSAKRLRKAVSRDKYLLLLSIIGIVYYIIFYYVPMYGVVIAFKDYSYAKGILGSPFVGLKHFKQFFEGMYFGRLLRNTLIISGLGILFGFPLPIIFALALEETKSKGFRKFVQCVSYLPHFISLVVVVGIVRQLFAADGIANKLVELFGGQEKVFLSSTKYFRTLYVGTEVWQHFAWNSILFTAAISGINPELYEACVVDGGGRWARIWHITLPGIRSTIFIMIILTMGNLLNVGFEKIILMYSPATYEVADVISTYVYRRGLLGSQFSFGSAVGLFNSLVNLIVVLSVNVISKKVADISLV